MIAPILRMARSKSLTLASLGMVFVASPAPAHHSAAAYDQSKSIDVKGVVTQWNYTMPHSWLEITVDEAGKDPVVWRFEGGGANTGDPRGGFTKDAIKAGDVVTVTTAPMRNGLPFGLLRAVTFDDGRMLGSKEQRPYGVPPGVTLGRPGAGNAPPGAGGPPRGHN